jgi:hypothetical protein
MVMKCPYCEKEMHKGYIYNGNQPMELIPECKKPSRFAFSTSEEGVKLNNKFSMFKTGGYNAEAYCCDTCHIVVAKTEE